MSDFPMPCDKCGLKDARNEDGGIIYMREGKNNIQVCLNCWRNSRDGR